jgi:cytochrome c biogenesis protein CcmG, thiol:disulfide interchange protein DsbE
VAVPVLALLAYGMTLDPRALPSTLPGKEAPAFALTAMERAGEARPPQPVVRLQEHRGEVVVLNFWASWCLACRSEHARSRASPPVRGAGGALLRRALQRQRPQRGALHPQMGGQSYPTLLDPGTRTAIDYGLYGVPETFFIDPDGRVAYKHVGPVTERLLMEWIERLRAPVEAS